ncbi:MAG: hypothetical protein ACOC0P_05350 [Planctomycetota bacterium]
MNWFVAIAACAAVAVTGCASDGDNKYAYNVDTEAITAEDVTYDAIRADLTPELITMTDRYEDIQGTVARTWDTNLRIFWEDWGRALLLDRPSRLSPKPIP